jgi:hypothetical protein
MTFDQLDPSAQAPWTRTILRDMDFPFISCVLVE